MLETIMSWIMSWNWTNILLGTLVFQGLVRSVVVKDQEVYIKEMIRAHLLTQNEIKEHLKRT